MCAHICIHVYICITYIYIYIYIPYVFSLLALPANPGHTSFMISSESMQAWAFATEIKDFHWLKQALFHAPSCVFCNH